MTYYKGIRSHYTKNTIVKQRVEMFRQDCVLKVCPKERVLGACTCSQ
jgi:hypothetical protein